MSALSPMRAGRITASRVPAILGLSPYQSRNDVLREMVREAYGADREFVGNVATEYGQRHEPDALHAYERLHGVMTFGGGDFVIHPDHDWLGCTPDGLVGDDGIVECKAPYRASYTHIDERQDYMAQVQFQLACTGRQWCDFVVWYPHETNVSQAMADPDWLPANMPALEAFRADYLAAIASEETAAPFLAPIVTQRDDAEWRNAAEDWRAAKRLADKASDAEAKARERLILLCGDRSSHGAGITLTRSERKGNVNYSRVPALAGIDLEPYRGKPSTVWTIRTDKEQTA